MTHRSERGRRLDHWRTRFVLLSLALGACTRASAPTPAADAAAPSTAVASAQEPPSPTPQTTPSPAPAEASSVAVTPPASATPVASATPAPENPWTTAQDCSKVESSAEAGQRARALANCKAKEEFRSFVAARQSCTATNQCAVVPGSCPFGCYVPATKASVGEVTNKLKELGARLEQAGGRCVYRCMSPPAEACVEGRCATAAP